MVSKIKFKQCLYMLCLLYVATLPYKVFAAEVNDAHMLFDKGNQAYKKTDYKSAIADYEQVVQEGFESADVYYNLGNAYYKNGDIAPAMLYYEKAHKLSPADAEINHNILFTRLRTIDKIDEEPQFFITRWWHSLITCMSLQALAVWSVISILAGSALLIYYLFADSVTIKKVSFYGSLPLFALGLIFIFIANRQSNYFANSREAVVFSNTTIVKVAPSNPAKTILVLHNGTKVSVVTNSGSWIKIKLANGTQGWITGSDVKEI